jgi:hypothetical protein
MMVLKVSWCGIRCGDCAAPVVLAQVQTIVMSEAGPCWAHVRAAGAAGFD